MKRVWIVDDDEEMVHAVQLMLKLLNCETRYFLSARAAAKALLAKDCPDLLVLDINLGEVSGIDLLEFLRQRPEWKDLPVVMLSTEVADTMIDKALALGADAYLTKPVAIDELEKAMDKASSLHGKS